jgi:hypothetical protein
MRTVFLDTVGLLAVWDVADQWHGVAHTAFGTLLAARVRLVTTPLVLYECGNAAARKPYRADVALFRDELPGSRSCFDRGAAGVNHTLHPRPAYSICPGRHAGSLGATRSPSSISVQRSSSSA